MGKEEICPDCSAWLLKDGTCLDCDSGASEEANQEVVNRAMQLPVFTVSHPKVLGDFVELGLVFGNSSKQAFLGLTTQANRISRAYEAALINLKYDALGAGADAVVGITFALNNSTGSNAIGIAGSSEAVMLLGTAVKRI